MTKEKFINTYQSAYVFDDVDDSNHIEVIGKKKTESEWDDFKDSVIIDLEADSCNIYQIFTYDNYSSLIHIQEINQEQLLLMQLLGKTYGIPPAVDCYDGLGCPFVDEHVGYFDVEYDLEKINCILSAFALALTAYEIDELDVEYLLNNFESDYRIYLNYTDDIRFGYRMLLGSDYSSVSERFFSKFGDVDNVYVDRVGALTVGFGEDSLKKISDLLKFDLFEAEADEIYIGFNYCLVRGGELTVSIDADYIKRINMFLDIMNIEDKDSLEYKINPYSILINTPYSDFWAIVMTLNGTQDIFALNERQYMQEMSLKLQPFISPELLYEEFIFSKLDDSAFEKMCRDLLIEMGFFNVVQRGKTRVSDGGIDLEADMVVKTPFEEQKQHWVFQCKHTKAQMNRKDISEIPDLLREFNANGYGLFYSGMLSPQTIDRIKSKNVPIKYWAKGELEILLRKYRKTAFRYFGI